MAPAQQLAAPSLHIAQLNCHRSTAITHSLLNDSSLDPVDIVLIQEPFAIFQNPISHHRWRAYGSLGPVPPKFQGLPSTQNPIRHPRVITYVHRQWAPGHIRVIEPSHPDLLCIELTLQDGSKVNITNIYNPPGSGSSFPVLLTTLRDLVDRRWQNIIAGDFNTHHPLWSPTYLRISSHAEALINAMTDCNLSLVTPPGLPTYTSSAGSHSTLDLTMASPGLAEKVLYCKLAGQAHGSDHDLVTTCFQLDDSAPKSPDRFNYNKCNWVSLASWLEHEWTAWTHVAGHPLSPEALDTWAEKWTESLRTGVETFCPIRRPSPYARPWWTPDLSTERSSLQRLRRTWQTSRADMDRDAYQQAKRRYKDRIRNAKRTHMRDSLRDASASNMWRLANAARPRARAEVAPLQTPTGSACTTPEQAEVLATEFFPPAPLAPANAPLPAGSHSPGHFPHRSMPWPDFTGPEVLAQIRRASPLTAPGPDGIPWMVLQKISAHWEGLGTVLASLFNHCVAVGYHPSVWKTATTVVIRKPGKPDYRAPNAYRPISLLNTTAKLLEGLVSRRILHAAEELPLLPPAHYGGRPKRATQDALLAIRQFARSAQRNHLCVAILLADVKGAYNAVLPGPLAHDLTAAGIPAHVIKWATSFMANRTTRLSIGGILSDLIPVPVGLPQGSPVSQLLWLFYSSGLVQISVGRQGQSLSTGWVDDWNLIISAPNMETLQDRLRTAGDAAATWALRHGASFDAGKTQVLYMAGPHLARLPVEIGTVQATVQEQSKILGLTFQSNGRWDLHVNSTVAKATRALQALMHWGKRTWGFSYHALRMIYLGGVVPILDYAIPVFVTGPVTTSSTIGASYQRVQRTAAIFITGAFKSTSTTALDFEASLLPVPLRLQLVQARSLLRLLTSPASHPTSQLVDQAQRVPPIRGLGPINALLRDFPTYSAANLERHIPAAPPWQQPPTIKVAASKDEACGWYQWIATTGNASHHIFTDGSKLDGKVGAGVVVTDSAMRTISSSCHRLDDSKTVFTAEVSAIKEAIATALSLSIPGPLNIWSDSQAAVQAIGSRQATDVRIRRLQDQLRSAPFLVTVHWIPGHADIPGNEEADLMAKAGTLLDHAGEQQPSQHSLFRHTLADTLGQWQALWESKGNRKHRSVNTMSPGMARKLHNNLSRAQSSLLVQLRTQHNGLRPYLLWRRVPGITTPLCETCGVPESVLHILILCPRFNAARSVVKSILGMRHAQSLRHLLNNRQAIPLVLRLAQLRFPAYKVGP
ncbi:uncharacterized protein MEPE_03736 [Melanopsichium pennsylvanicum]|nr:protein [Melanopsichium pennsylvanicum 4]SNX85028.1 uncharacterized protein MEPE_03736 [Melanopsichium pennsylvanicum]